MKREIQAKPYALVREWKDNPMDVQVIEWFVSVKEAEEYRTRLKKSELYIYKIMQYV